MRHALVVGCLVALAACDPGIKTFDVTPAQLSCPGNVTVAWEGDADGGRLETDQPVTPPFPPTVLKKGSKVETVVTTTTFMFSYPSAAHREKKVTVTNASCGGGSGCSPQVLTFTGTCSSGSGPSYITLDVNAANAPGNLKDLTSDADFPVHVQHGGQDIALGAGGGPVFPPLPVVPAAGSYTITVPGQVGIGVCGGAGPTRGGGDAPVIHITVTPTCPVK